MGAFVQSAGFTLFSFALVISVVVFFHEVGHLKPQSPAAQPGLQYGDKILAIDGEPVDGWSTLQEKIRAKAGEPLSMQIERRGRLQQLLIVPAVHEETSPIETVKHGRIGISAVPRTAEVTVISPDSPAGRAGLRTFDKVLKLDGARVANYEDLAQRLGSSDKPLRLELLRPEPVAAPGGTLWRETPLQLELPAPPRPGEYGIEASDLTLFAVQPGSAADEAGLRRGDRVLAVGGVPALSWSDEVDSALKAAGTQPVPIAVRREGKELTVSVQQHLRKD